MQIFKQKNALFFVSFDMSKMNSNFAQILYCFSYGKVKKNKHSGCRNRVPW